MGAFRPPADAWSRRDFMRNGFCSIALCARSGRRRRCKGDERHDVRRAARAGRLAVHAVPARPADHAGAHAGLHPPRRRCLRRRHPEGLAEILPGFQTPIYGYDGIYPGPTIRARKGRAAVVRQKNRLPFDTNVHLHGGYVPAAHDGHPMDVILPGKGFDYVYPNDQDAAFLWYHDHAHGRTARTLYYGLVATYLLGDEREEELELPQGEYDVPLVLADHAFNRDGSFRYAENVDLGFRGDTILVNGAVSPRMRVAAPDLPAALPQRVQRALLRAAARQGRARCCRSPPTAGCSSGPSRARAFPLHPAERIEVLVDFRGFRPGSEIVLQNAGGEATTRNVMRFDVVGGGGSEEARCRAGGCARSRSCPRRTRAAAGTSRWPRRRASSGRSPARVRPGAHRRARRGWARRSSGSGTTRPTACTRCTCTGCCSGSSSAAAGVIHPGERALEGHDRRAAGRDRHGPAVVRSLRGPLRLPLPRARARRQGDDAAAGGGAMRRAVLLGVALASWPLPPLRPERGRRRPRRDLDWDKPAVTVAPGETVTWTFAGTQLPTTCSPRRGEGWGGIAAGRPAPDGSYTFDAEGTYDFVCQVHPSTMVGTVTVGHDPVPRRRRPLCRDSQQPYTNDDTTPVTLEKVEVDDDAPRLTAVSARRVARGSRACGSGSPSSRRWSSASSATAGRSDGPVRGRRVARRDRADAAAAATASSVRATDIAGNRSLIREHAGDGALTQTCGQPHPDWPGSPLI